MTAGMNYDHPKSGKKTYKNKGIGITQKHTTRHSIHKKRGFEQLVAVDKNEITALLTTTIETKESEPICQMVRRHEPVHYIN